MTTPFSNCFSHNFSKKVPLLVQDGSAIHFSSILWSCITLTPHSLEMVILQRFQLCFIISPITTLNSYMWEATAVSFHFPFCSFSQCDLITRMSNHLLHSVNFLLTKTSPPSSKHYFPTLLSLALMKMKNSVNSSDLRLLWKAHHCLKSLSFHTIILTFITKLSIYTTELTGDSSREDSDGYCVPIDSLNYCH